MTSPATAKLDQAVIDAGYELVHAHRSDPPDPERIRKAREALEVAREARWPSD
jgi:hypothetical protein